MNSLEYLQPRDVDEAIALLAGGDGEFLPVTGATDVWAGIRSGKLAPKGLVSLRGIDALHHLRLDPEALVVGAAVTHGRIEDDPAVAAAFPALHRACSAVGSRQIRNVASLGGNLCNAAPSADSAVPALLYDAVCVARGTGGRREIPVAEFFLGPGRNALSAGEILEEIRFPRPPPGTRGEYWKLTRRKGVELPILGVGVRLTPTADGRAVDQARIALGVAGPVPLRAHGAEALLVGEALTPERVRRAAEAAAEESQVRDSWRGKAWYRREMIRVLIPRVIERAGAFGS
jgi:CO/xanthine dehydrogenase FAD-binding subunit